MNENVIDIEGVIGWEVTARGVKRALSEMGDVAEIDVNINSPGGYIDDGFGIYTALKNHSAIINIHITGMAASMASVIAMCGDSVTIEPTGMFMIHPPSNIVWGTAVDLRKGADVLDKYETRLVKAYNSRELNLDADELAEAIADETWYTSDEVVAAGFADSVSEGNSSGSMSDESSANALAWMKVAAFKNAPEDVAESFGFYKTNKINNAATKKMVKALATDGPAVETTKGNEMTDEVTLSEADIVKAVEDNNSKWVALLSHPNAGNTAAVIKIAAKNMSAEDSAEMMDLVAAPVVETAAKAEAEEKETAGTAPGNIAEQFAAFMASSEANKANKNAGSQEAEDKQVVAFDAAAEHKRLKGDL